jgi:hypothetical protein
MTHERIEVPALLAFCDPKLWERGPYHSSCYGRSIVKFHEPSGTGPWLVGICTCPCHVKGREPGDETEHQEKP